MKKERKKKDIQYPKDLDIQYPISNIFKKIHSLGLALDTIAQASQPLFLVSCSESPEQVFVDDYMKC